MRKLLALLLSLNLFVVALLPGCRQVVLQFAGLVAGQVGIRQIIAPQQQAHAVRAC